MSGMIYGTPPGGWACCGGSGYVLTVGWAGRLTTRVSACRCLNPAVGLGWLPYVQAAVDAGQIPLSQGEWLRAAGFGLTPAGRAA